MTAIAGRHDRGLGVFGEGQIAFRAFPHQPRQLLRQRVIDFLEDFARRRERIGQGLAHADGLAALSGKNECASHCGGRQIKHALHGQVKLDGKTRARSRA